MSGGDGDRRGVRRGGGGRGRPGRERDVRVLVALLEDVAGVRDLGEAAARHGWGVGELVEWAGREKTAGLAGKLDRFQRLLTRLLVTTACVRAASRLAMRHAEGEGEDGEGGVRADKLDLDILKGLLPRLGEGGFERSERAEVDAGGDAGAAVGGAVGPTASELEAVRLALEAMGDPGDEDDGLGVLL